jgi:hypothetical protein
MPDTAEIPTGTIVAIHAEAVVADIVDLVAIDIRERCALAARHDADQTEAQNRQTALFEKRQLHGTTLP